MILRLEETIMANYVSTTRTNYFHVKDVETFRAFIILLAEYPRLYRWGMNAIFLL